MLGEIKCGEKQGLQAKKTFGHKVKLMDQPGYPLSECLNHGKADLTDDTNYQGFLLEFLL